MPDVLIINGDNTSERRPMTADETAEWEAAQADVRANPEPEPVNLAAEVAELRGRLDRAAAASVTGDAAKLRDQMKPNA